MSGYDLRALVGLGNPGTEYKWSRHNAGFWLADRLAESSGVEFRHEAKFRGLVARGRCANFDLVILKPVTFMNLSGESIQSFARYYKLRPAQFLIAHDELDLPPGTVRIKRGGHSRHNGLRSIQQHLGDGYLRLRIGIGHPGVREDIVGYVLGRPTPEEYQEINKGIDKALGALTTLTTQGLDKALQELHSDREPEILDGRARRIPCSR